MLLSWCHLISLVLSHWCQLRFRKNNDWYSKCAVFGCNNTKNKEKDLCVHTVPNINIHETACKINSAFSWVELNLLDSNPHATQRKSHFFKNVLTKSETFSLRDLISSSKAKLLSVSISTISSAPSAVSTCKPLQNRLYYNWELLWENGNVRGSENENMKNNPNLVFQLCKRCLGFLLEMEMMENRNCTFGIKHRTQMKWQHNVKFRAKLLTLKKCYGMIVTLALTFSEAIK